MLGDPYAYFLNQNSNAPLFGLNEQYASWIGRFQNAAPFKLIKKVSDLMEDRLTFKDWAE